MDIAHTSDYQLVNARNAVNGKTYYCPVCNGRLYFYAGLKQIPHFRHSKGVPIEQKEQCELYAGVNSNSQYFEENFARQRIRMIIDKINDSFIFKMKFPMIRKELLDMQINDKYFNYYCSELKSFSLNSIQLLPSRMNNDIEVPLLREYTIYSSNEKYEKILGLKASGKYVPFKEGPLIFKEVFGQYISIPYRRLTLSGRFFVVSLSVISFEGEIEVLSSKRFNNFFIYEMLMPLEVTEKLQSFFKRNLKYTVLPATCHIDLISPSSFKKKGNSIEVSTGETTWQFTNLGEAFSNQKVVIENKSHERRMINLDSNNKFSLSMVDDEYYLYLNHGISEFITIKKVSRVEHSSNFKQQLLLEDESVLFKSESYRKNEEIEILSTLTYYISNNDEIDYKVSPQGKTPLIGLTRLTIPTLWTIKFDSGNEEGLFNFRLIYSIYKNHKLYPKEICNLKAIQILKSEVVGSHFREKDKLIYFISLLGHKVPRPIASILKEIERKNDSLIKNIQKNSD